MAVKTEARIGGVLYGKEDIKKFDRLGYSFRSDLSSDVEYVFERKR